MANFEREGVRLEVPDSAVGVLQNWFRKVDSEVTALSKELSEKNNAFEESKKKFELDSKRIESDSLVKIETLQGKVDALEAEIKANKEKPNLDAERLKARRQLEKKALAVIKRVDGDFDDGKFDLLDDRAIKVGAIQTRWKDKFDSKYFENKSDEAIDGMFEVVCTVEPDFANNLKKAIENIESKEDSVSKIDSVNKNRANFLASNWNWIHGDKK